MSQSVGIDIAEMMARASAVLAANAQRRAAGNRPTPVAESRPTPAVDSKLAEARKQEEADIAAAIAASLKEELPRHHAADVDLGGLGIFRGVKGESSDLKDALSVTSPSESKRKPDAPPVKLVPGTKLPLLSTTLGEGASAVVLEAACVYKLRDAKTPESAWKTTTITVGQSPDNLARIEKIVRTELTIKSVTYRLRDYGHEAEEHKNACFYLTICQGDQAAAVKLKNAIAPVATKTANALKTDIDLKKSVDFLEKSAFADTEVVEAYMEVTKRDVLVYNENIGAAVLYSAKNNLGAPDRLFLRGRHYWALERAPQP